MKKMIIAIDGFSSSGKSTLAKALAKQLAYAYIDTGAMYRAVTLCAIQKELFSNGVLHEQALKDVLDACDISFRYNETLGKNETWLNGKLVEDEIRSLEVANLVSHVSAFDFVREKMVYMQRQMGLNKGIVMDGRDIGTVVFPEAELKFFITARPEIRAERRYKELVAKGEHVSYEEVFENIRLRDVADQSRAISPLKKAADAIVLDNSNMTLEEQEGWLLEQCKMKSA